MNQVLPLTGIEHPSSVHSLECDLEHTKYFDAKLRGFESASEVILRQLSRYLVVKLINRGNILPPKDIILLRNQREDSSTITFERRASRIDFYLQEFVSGEFRDDRLDLGYFQNTEENKFELKVNSIRGSWYNLLSRNPNRTSGFSVDAEQTQEGTRISYSGLRSICGTQLVAGQDRLLDLEEVFLEGAVNKSDKECELLSNQIAYPGIKTIKQRLKFN